MKLTKVGSQIIKTRLNDYVNHLNYLKIFKNGTLHLKRFKLDFSLIELLSLLNQLIVIFGDFKPHHILTLETFKFIDPIKKKIV